MSVKKYPLTYKPVDTDETVVLNRKSLQDKLLDKVKEISGENVYTCMQCGKCSAGCPLADEMDYTPAQLLKLLQIGQYKMVAQSKSIWLCASCFMCTSRCPKGVDLAKLLEALRQIILRKGMNHVDPAKIPERTLEEIPQVALISCLRKFSG